MRICCHSFPTFPYMYFVSLMWGKNEEYLCFPIGMREMRGNENLDT